MDKQKQIEEMAKEISRILFEDCLLNIGGSCADCEWNGKDTKEYDCQSLLVAKKLLEKYQPKIPENAVLTGEEYSDYLVLKDAHQNAIERCEKLQADNERLYKNIGKFKDTVRKETAEKFAERAKEVLGSRFNYIDSLIKSKIDEICKEITGKN